MRSVLTIALLACGPDAAPPSPLDDAEPSVQVYLSGKPTKVGGTLVVVVEAPGGAGLDLPEPEVEGLDFREKGEARVETVGERVVVTRTFAFSGAAGHYEVPSLVATWTGGEVASPPLWIDLDVDPPREGEIADIEDPPAIWPFPWEVAAGAVGIGALMAGGLWLAFRRPDRRVAEAPPDPPDVIALRAWDRVRRDPAIAPYDKAVELSRIFREYAEAVLAFPATSNTTTENVAHLSGMPHLPEGNVPRAKRLLRATDLVKYADASTHEEFFEELDSDLRAFIGSTRPYGARGAV